MDIKVVFSFKDTPLQKHEALFKDFDAHTGVVTLVNKKPNHTSLQMMGYYNLIVHEYHHDSCSAFLTYARYPRRDLWEMFKRWNNPIENKWPASTKKEPIPKIMFFKKEKGD